jgi:sterol desaturase/sphingolipid hydroxylase (fatty acid hydroxylase superfamily)
MSLLTYTGLTLSVVLTLMLCERRWAASTERSSLLVNLTAYLLFTAAGLFLLPQVAPSMGGSLVSLADLPFLVGLAIFTVLMDLGEFLFHRAQHNIPWLWRMHALHHSGPNMNTTTTARHYWAEPLIKAVTIWPLCAVLTSPTIGITTTYAVISIYHYFVHANLRIGFGRWSWVLNSPAYHRRHHSALPEHFNSNYASLFPIFDVLTGSYRRPAGFPPTGLMKTPRSLADVVFWPLRTSER